MEELGPQGQGYFAGVGRIWDLDALTPPGRGQRGQG